MGGVAFQGVELFHYLSLSGLSGIAIWIVLGFSFLFSYLHFRAGYWLGSACFNLWGVCFFTFQLSFAAFAHHPLYSPSLHRGTDGQYGVFDGCVDFSLGRSSLLRVFTGLLVSAMGSGGVSDSLWRRARVIISSAVLFTMGWGYSGFLKRGQ